MKDNNLNCLMHIYKGKYYFALNRIFEDGKKKHKNLGYPTIKATPESFIWYRYMCIVILF